MINVIESLEHIKNKYMGIQERLADPDVIQDRERFTKLHKEFRELESIVQEYDQYRLLIQRKQEAELMLKEEDPEMRDMAKEEIQKLDPLLIEKEQVCRMMLIPKDPEDSKNVILEIRAGTGGDEAGIFAGDLYRMYSRYCDMRKWEIEILDSNDGTAGGYSKIIAEIRGEQVYGALKFESGAHRVQRVPKTESQGRIHTSAATVAIIPEVELEEVNINKADLKIDTFRSSGAGGQHVNKTESGVRFTHIPTGTVSESTDGRSQIQNREIAFQRLYQKIKDTLQSKQEKDAAQLRRSLVGTGDRSDKIRTYNYPQNRITDHRINYTVYNLDQVMEGNIHDILEQLRVAENTERLKALEMVN